MTVHDQPVHLGIAVIRIQQIKGAAIVGGFQGAEHVGGKDRPVRSKLSEDCLADVGRHAVQPCLGVFGTQRLVFVVIGIRDFDLAHRLWGEGCAMLRTARRFPDPNPDGMRRSGRIFVRIANSPDSG